MQSESIPTQERVFDLDAVLEMVDGEVELVQQLAQMLIDDLPDLSVQLRLGVAGNDVESVKQLTHRLKSSVGNLGGRRSQAAVRELELAARSGDLSNAAPLLAQCQHELSEFQSQLQRFIAG